MKRARLRKLAYFLVAGGLVLIVWQLGPLSWLKERRTMTAIIAACKGGAGPGGLVIKYPLSGTLFPPGLPPPTLMWRDSTGVADAWLVVVQLQDTEEPFTAWTNDGCCCARSNSAREPIPRPSAP